MCAGKSPVYDGFVRFFVGVFLYYFFQIKCKKSVVTSKILFAAGVHSRSQERSDPPPPPAFPLINRFWGGSSEEPGWAVLFTGSLFQREDIFIFN